MILFSMEKFTTLTSIALPLDKANVDTDAIIPKQFLKSIKRTGFGDNLFDSWRYLDYGDVDSNNLKRKINPDFILNNPKYKNARILIARDNFGCGSSREHAPWALKDYGFRAIIAPSFADIFYSNCFKNGILPIIQNNDIMDELFNYDGELNIDLKKQIIKTNVRTYTFHIEEEFKYRLINGLDDIGITLKYIDEIKEFESKYFDKYPWL